MALAAVLLRTIDSRGFLSSVIVGVAVVYGGGFSWFLVVAVFFVLGVVFTLYKYGYKRRIGGAQGKGGARNWPHILANGGFASAVAICNYIAPNAAFPALFLGAISTSAADTAATELGLLSHSRPRLITHPTRWVSPGTSGGVSPLGFGGAVLASLVIGALAALLGVISGPYLVLSACVAGGVFGTLVDSLMGAAVQRKGYCIICMKPTEDIKHCGEPSRPTAGVSYVENNVVNVVSTVAGALAALAVVFSLQALGSGIA